MHCVFLSSTHFTRASIWILAICLTSCYKGNILFEINEFLTDFGISVHFIFMHFNLFKRCSCWINILNIFFYYYYNILFTWIFIILVLIFLRFWGSNSIVGRLYLKTWLPGVYISFLFIEKKNAIILECYDFEYAALDGSLLENCQRTIKACLWTG